MSDKVVLLLCRCAVCAVSRLHKRIATALIAPTPHAISIATTEHQHHLDPFCLIIEHRSDVSKAESHTTSNCLTGVSTIEQAIYAAHDPVSKNKLSLRQHVQVC